MRYLYRSAGLFWLFLSLPLCLPLFAADYKISLTVESGFFQREDELVKAEIEFKKEVDSGSFLLVEGEKMIPFYFFPKDKYRGDLYWVLSGTTEALSSRIYYLHFSEGGWNNEPSGSEEVASLVRERVNLIPNPGFEIEEEAEIKSNWKGKTKPTHWDLNDYAWVHRDLPDLISRSRLSEEESYEGKRSLKIVSEVREGKNITGFASSSVFPLKPNTMYSFSFHLKIIEREDSGSITAEIQFLDENKKRVRPRDFGLNRLLVGYSTNHHPQEEYLGKWVKVEGVKVTPAEVRYGRVLIAPWYFSGTVYYDNLTLSKMAPGEPVQVEVGKIERKK